MSCESRDWEYRSITIYAQTPTAAGGIMLTPIYCRSPPAGEEYVIDALLLVWYEDEDSCGIYFRTGGRLDSPTRAPRTGELPPLP